MYVVSQKNILKYFCSEKIIHNTINEECHINLYRLNINNLLHSSIFMEENRYSKLARYSLGTLIHEENLNIVINQLNRFS
jgi:hypothetical protein